MSFIMPLKGIGPMAYSIPHMPLGKPVADINPIIADHTAITHLWLLARNYPPKPSITLYKDMSGQHLVGDQSTS